MLSMLARKYLAIPASSTPSERTFSAAGNLIRDDRVSLSPDVVNVVLFLRSCYRNDIFG